MYLFFSIIGEHKSKYWYGRETGFAIFHKRLEEGTFELPVFLHDQKHVVISYSQLVLILQGISLSKIHYRRRYRKESVAH
ncbi:IS66 family insertion sequence element accessory protein TnpB [Chitinophaga sp. S165]|uniref:IS66 family insertion sequence element accessory protein TnpB n=1 Tax=Chitinophaga sp. S165 TaxID=2135462 RepID=UPI000D7094F2